jgi:hypothetical protein
MKSILKHSYFKHLQHFVAVVVYDFDGDLSGFGLGEWAAYRDVKTTPCQFVDIRTQDELMTGFSITTWLMSVYTSKFKVTQI